MIYNSVVEFNEWIIQKYRDWRGNAIGRERTVKQYAEEYIGVSQQLMSDWMKAKDKKGKIPTTAVNIGKLFAVYGEEIFTVLPHTDDDNAVQLLAMYYTLPGEVRLRMVNRVAQLVLEMMGSDREE